MQSLNLTNTPCWFEENKCDGCSDSKKFFWSWWSPIQKNIDYLRKKKPGHHIWKKHVTILQHVQRRAMKRVGRFRPLSYSERLKKLNLPSLVHRRTRDKFDKALQTNLIELFFSYQKISHLERVLVENTTTNCCVKLPKLE